MADTGVTVQITHIAGAEHITHHAFAFMHMEHIALYGHDTGRILPTVLQHL